MPHLLSIIVALALTGIVVTLHYEALNLLDRLTKRLGNHRITLLFIMFGLLTAHVIEIWVFAFGYYVAVDLLALGHFVPSVHSPFDYSYYSAMVYTTVGFGDIIPNEQVRMITSAEALTGLALITWSASYTFLHMRKLWRD